MSNSEILKRIGVEKTDGSIAAVAKVGEFIESSDDRLAAANTIIKGLGGTDEQRSDRARIVAKTMVSQVIAHKKADQAEAQRKADAMLTKDPAFKRDELVEKAQEKKPAAYTPKTNRRKGAGNEKHAKADAFVEANKGKFTDRGELVRATAAHLGVDYAGAYFYVKRAEAKFGLKLTARKGRRPKAKPTE